jgi:hypothetical protein
VWAASAGTKPLTIRLHNHKDRFGRLCRLPGQRSKNAILTAWDSERIQLDCRLATRTLEKSMLLEIAHNLWVVFLVFALIFTLGITFVGMMYAFSEPSGMSISIPLTASTFFLSALFSTALARAIR